MKGPVAKPGGRMALAALPVLAFGTLGLLFMARRDPPAPALRPVLTVAVARPARDIWPRELAAQGLVAPWQEASIGTQIGSYQLVEVRVNVGDAVARGQVLARLNPALLRAGEAQLAARDDQARANHRRAQALQQAGGISDQDALEAATEARTAAALLAARRLELRYTAITAPDDGVISARSATLGAVVPAGQELFRMIRRNRLEWRGELPPAQLADLRPGQAVSLTLPDGSHARATLRQSAPALDSASRMAILYADLAPGSAARAGMHVAGRITLGESPALTLPAACVMLRDGRSNVAMLLQQGAVARVMLRPVATGRRHGDRIEITAGLHGDERLVLRGGAFLNDGDIVRIAKALP